MTEQIAELKRLNEAATPGPWQARFLHRVFQSARMHAAEDRLYFHKPESQDWADCEAIAALRNAAPALIAAWERAGAAERELAELRRALRDEHKAGCRLPSMGEEYCHCFDILEAARKERP